MPRTKTPKPKIAKKSKPSTKMPKYRDKHIPKISRVRTSRVTRNGGVKMIKVGAYSKDSEGGHVAKPNGPDVAKLGHTIARGPLGHASSGSLLGHASSGPLIEDGPNPLIDR